MRFYWTCVYIRIHYNDACNKCVSCHVICGLQYQCGHVHVYVDVYILYIIYIYVCECRCEHIIVSVNCTGSILCGILMQIGLREKPSPRAKFTCGMSHSGEPTRCFSASACLESWSKVRLYPYCEMVISHTYIIIICHTYRYDLWPAYKSNAIYPRVSTVCELESHRLNRSSSNRPGERKARGNRWQSVCWGPWRSGATEKVPSGHRKNDGKNTMFS